MFDLVTGNVQRPLQERGVAPTLVSIAAHLLVATIVAVPILYVTNALPDVPEMMAFVAEPPPVPPPPAPPPAPALPHPAASAVARMVTSAVPPPRGPSAPVDAPPAITQETDVPQTTDFAGGEGGIDGGAAGGGVGGLVGGKLTSEPTLAPAPPALPPAGPVRVGALIKAPELIHKVQPTYPDIAVAAQLEGVVILEAAVGVDGQVASVRVLASRNHLLDAAAIDAVQHWRYAPLLLNGKPVAFVLTVTVDFSLRRKP
jgi:protein TonB